MDFYPGLGENGKDKSNAVGAAMRKMLHKLKTLCGLYCGVCGDYRLQREYVSVSLER